MGDGAEHHRPGAGGLDDHVGIDLCGDVVDVAVVIGGAQRGDDARFGSVGDAVQHVGLQTLLHRQQRRQQTDRACAGNQHALRVEERAFADAADLFPRLGHHGGGFHQHAHLAQPGVQADRVVGFHGPALAAVPVAFLDAAFGVAAVAAHVELAVRARPARHRVGSAHHADDEVPLAEPAARWRGHHPAQRFVSEHEAVAARRCPPVVAGGDLLVGAADTDRQPVDQQVTGIGVGVGDLFDAQRRRGARCHSQCLHQDVVASPAVVANSATIALR